MPFDSHRNSQLQGTIRRAFMTNDGIDIEVPIGMDIL